MSEELEMQDDLSPEAELAELKITAKRMNIKFSPNIGLDALREKVAQELAENTEGPATASPKTQHELHAQCKQQASKLIRVKIACLNPVKKEWPGEVFSAGNDIAGNFTKFIPFNSDKPYHIPQIILNALQEKMCQVFVTSSLPNGEKTRVGKLIKEFNIEILPPLTEQELADLAKEQAARHSID